MKEQILWEQKLYKDFLELTEGDVPVRKWAKTQLKKLMQNCDKKTEPDSNHISSQEQSIKGSNLSDSGS
jgi:hypothetical protein